MSKHTRTHAHTHISAVCVDGDQMWSHLDAGEFDGIDVVHELLKLLHRQRLRVLLLVKL